MGARDETPRGRGLVAIGDSITRGEGDAMQGLRMQSWALWLAEALELPYTCLARNGARAADALAEQVPRLRGPYDLGCVYLGVNDVRAPGVDVGEFARSLRAVTEMAAACCTALLLVSLPPAIGVPPAPAGAIAGANRHIAAIAAEHGAVLVGLQSLSGPLLLQPDRVHLTARGEAHVALCACRALERAGTRAGTAELVRALEPLTLRARARWMLGGRLAALGRDVRRRLRERAAGAAGVAR
jgi:lysophospholipase L1-like esterase